MENLTILEKNDFTINDFAYQLTAYEKWGCIDYKDACIDLIITDYLEEADINDLLSTYNDYLDATNNLDDMYYYNDDDFFNEYFNGCEPMRIIQATYFGDYRYMDDFVQFNGYGNLNSFQEYEVKRNIQDDDDFKSWLFDNIDIFEELREEENKKMIINKAIELVKAGY